MNEHELMKQEYIFAKEMIFRIRDIVWILFGFFVTVNLAFYGFIIQFILKSPDFVDKLFSQHISFGLLFAGLIITIVNVTILKIWLREHTQQKENLEAINWIRENICRSDKKNWLFYNPWRHDKKDKYENPEKNKTFEAIGFLLIFFVVLSLAMTFIGLFFTLALNCTKILLILLGGFAILYSIFEIFNSCFGIKKHEEYIENVRKHNRQESLIS